MARRVGSASAENVRSSRSVGISVLNLSII
jgi:hypothetical protein